MVSTRISWSFKSREIASTRGRARRMGYGESLSLRLMCPKMRTRASWILSRSVAESSSFRGKSFINWLYLWAVNKLSLRVQMQLLNKLTSVGSFLETRVRYETNSSMKTLGIPQAIHDHVDLLTSQLSLNSFQCSFPTQPEIDFL